jgi:hypothetical protein
MIQARGGPRGRRSSVGVLPSMTTRARHHRSLRWSTVYSSYLLFPRRHPRAAPSRASVLGSETQPGYPREHVAEPVAPQCPRKRFSVHESARICHDLPSSDVSVSHYRYAVARAPPACSQLPHLRKTWPYASAWCVRCCHHLPRGFAPRRRRPRALYRGASRAPAAARRGTAPRGGAYEPCHRIYCIHLHYPPHHHPQPRRRVRVLARHPGSPSRRRPCHRRWSCAAQAPREPGGPDARGRGSGGKGSASFHVHLMPLLHHLLRPRTDSPPPPAPARCSTCQRPRPASRCCARGRLRRA